MQTNPLQHDLYRVRLNYIKLVQTLPGTYVATLGVWSANWPSLMFTSFVPPWEQSCPNKRCFCESQSPIKVLNAINGCLSALTSFALEVDNEIHKDHIHLPANFDHWGHRQLKLWKWAWALCFSLVFLAWEPSTASLFPQGKYKIWISGLILCKLAIYAVIGSVLIRIRSFSFCPLLA